MKDSLFADVDLCTSICFFKGQFAHRIFAVQLKDLLNHEATISRLHFEKIKSVCIISIAEQEIVLHILQEWGRGRKPS